MGNTYILMGEDLDPLVASLSEEDMLDSYISYMNEGFDTEIKKEDLSIKYNSYIDGGAILIKNKVVQRFVIVNLYTK